VKSLTSGFRLRLRAIAPPEQKNETFNRRARIPVVGAIFHPMTGPYAIRVDE
jgi:hypothetical protein